MGLKKLTEIEIASGIMEDAEPNVYVENNGELYRTPLKLVASMLDGRLDVSFDEDEGQLYLVDGSGKRIGYGTQIVAGINSLNMVTEEDDSGNYYLVTYDAKGVELCRVEFQPTGGGSGTAYVCRLINGMTSARLSVPAGQSCVLSYEFLEMYGQIQTTVNATAKYYIKGSTGDYMLISTQDIQQGANKFDATQYLSTGTNYLKISVTGGESGIEKTLVFTLNVVDISITSTFDDTVAYTGSISYLYKVYGKSLDKVMHFIVDGEPYAEVSIGTSHNVQLSQIINLAKYGHGAHSLEVYFTTSDGTKSPSLKYDIIYSTGESDPIVASSFEVESVTYGEPIYVNYVVFTNGKDYTDVVNRRVYSLDGEGKQVNYTENMQYNVINQKTQSWTITDYPSSGDIYIEISSGISVKTFKVEVEPVAGDRDFSPVNTRLVAAFSANGRSNNDANRDSFSSVYTTKDGVKTSITATISGSNHSSNGWLADNDGYPVLRVSGGMEVNMNLPFLSASYTDSDGNKVTFAGTPTTAGRTFEVEFNAHDVTDSSNPIITMWDGETDVGIKIFPTRAYMLSDSMGITTDGDGNITNKNNIPYVEYKSGEKVRLGFVIEQQGYYVEDDGTKKQLCRIYVNGELSKAVAYSTDSFTTDAKLRISTDGCIVDVYSMRFYDYAIGHEGILKNRIADMPSISDKISEYDANDIMDDSGDISYDLCLTKYPCMVLTGALSAYKGNKVKVGVYFTKPDGESDDGFYAEIELMDKDSDGKYGNVNNVQGTSSQYYIKKNYKITFYRWDEVNGKWVKVKYKIFDDAIPVNTVCVKADYMSMDGANTANANFWQTVVSEKTPPQEKDERVQTAVRGYCIMMFQRDTESDKPSFIGRYNLNNDKSNYEAFGLTDESDDGNNTLNQKWEYLDNSEDICNWKTDKLKAPRNDSDGGTYPAWMDALESCYPDQGDLEDEGLTPNLDYIQPAYTWVVQRANFWEASREKDGRDYTYKGISYETEYDMKLAIYKAEFTKHFNLHHTTYYFVSNEIPLLVDNFSKNFFATFFNTYEQNLVFTDGSTSLDDITDEDGTVDASKIDWEKSTFAILYPSLYDMDSCLGKDNNGFDQFPYYAEMWDTYNGSMIVNGSENLFWKMFYAAFYSEIKAFYKTKMDTDKSLTYDKYIKALITDSTASLPTVAINLDQKFKYIDAYEGGYLDYSTNSWLFTSAYLYLARGTMSLKNMDYLYKRFRMFESKYMTDAYMQDNFNLRVNAGQANPEDLAFNVTPAQALYCYTEWGNSGSYIGRKCLEGESVEMKPTSSGNWFDIVLAIYGASKIKSFGDLSRLIPSKLQGLSICSLLEELILGSEDEGYENSMLTSVADASYLSLLKTINVSNCTALAGNVDLSGCSLIETVLAVGSALSSITLPTDGYLRKLHLPGTTSSLIVLDHTELDDFYIDGTSNLQKIWIEDVPLIRTDELLLGTLKQLSRVRLVDVEWTLDNEELLTLLVSDAAKGKQIDVNGNEIDNPDAYPVITGTVAIDRIQGSLYTALKEAYPNLTINYKTKYHSVVFYDWDGSVVNSQSVNDNSSASTPRTPQRDNDVQYVWSFRSWDTAYSKVTSDLKITAQYSSSLQVYDIEFYDSENDNAYLTTVEHVSYSTTYEFPQEWPTAEGKLFTGWKDSEGNFYAYEQQMPDRSAKIDENGLPLTIQLYSVYEDVAFPENSKSLEELTEGEKLFAAIAVQNGSAEGCTVTYYPDTMEYVIQQSETLNTISLAPADEFTFTMYGGEQVTMYIGDFNHDYSDLEETKKLGITYLMKNLFKDRQNMNPSYKHCFNFTIGDGEAIVSDDLDHSSATDSLLTNTHNVTDEEAEEGYCNITAVGQTYLSTIIVKHSDGTSDTWHFDYKGFYADDDNAYGYQKKTWYLSDSNEDENNRYYKIGRMMQSLDDTIDWTKTQLQSSYFQNDTHEFKDFGGIIFEATGVDTFNTPDNAYDGTGVSRIRYLADYSNDWNNFIEMTEGSVIKVPVSEGDKLTVKCYGYSCNWLGWEGSANRSRIPSIVKKLPIAIRNIIVPACKRGNVGNRSYTVHKTMDTMWLISNMEVRGWTTTHPYMDEGSPYPVFTDNESRKKRLNNGLGDLYWWWGRSPYDGYSDIFTNTNADGNPNNNHWANGTRGECLGFSSGSAETE